MSIAASGVMSMSGTETGFLWSGGSVPVRIGATIPTGAGSGGTDGSYYVPIYNSYGGDRVVIGFGYAAVVYSLNGKTCWVSPVHRWMASAGASALAAEGIPGTATYVSFVSSQNASLQKALMAPALAR